MDRRSLSNSLPPQVSRRRSPTYPAPRDHRGGRSYRSPPRDKSSPHRFLKRSPSLRPCKSGRSPSKEASLKRNRKAASTARPKLKAFDFEADDDEARQTFCCVHCNVKLHDLISIESHLRGGPHLMQQQRLKDYQLRIATGHGLKARHPPGLGQVEKENDSKLKEEYREEATNLKKQLKMCQSKLKELQEYKKFCLDTHENKDFKKLLEHERQCIENHQRPIELNKPGIYCKRERDTSPHEPTSRRAVKMLKRHSYHESDEDRDRKRSFKSDWRLDESGRDIKSEECGRRLDEGKQDIKLHRRSGEGGSGSFKSERRSDGGDSWHTPNESNEARDGRMEYIENEIDENLKVESDYSEKYEYVESESKLKNELNFDDDIILLE